MELRSVGLRTDLMLIAFEGEVIDRGAYMVARSPEQPGFFWGNFVIFPEAPAPGQISAWEKIFAREIAEKNPNTHHVLMAWDGPDLSPESLAIAEERGFKPDRSVALATSTLRKPAKWNEEMTVRVLKTDAEWEEAIQTQILCRSPEFELESYVLFKRRQMNSRRRMAEQGLGAWFGAYLGDRQVANLGVYVKDGLARYQTVGTHPDFRRRGLCGRLVYEAGNHALASMGAKKLVMCADEDYHAAKIYESVGFVPVERFYALTKW